MKLTQDQNKKGVLIINFEDLNLNNRSVSYIIRAKLISSTDDFSIDSL